MININKFKDYKKHKIISSDLTTILKIINLTLSAMQPFIKYKPVQEIISYLQNQKTLLDVYSGKMKKHIKEYEGENGL